MTRAREFIRRCHGDQLMTTLLTVIVGVVPGDVSHGSDDLVASGKQREKKNKKLSNPTLVKFILENVNKSRTSAGRLSLSNPALVKFILSSQREKRQSVLTMIFTLN
jgi:hypothetical protein